MGMEFTVNVYGRVRFDGLDASDVGIDESQVIEGEVGYGNPVSFEDATVVSGEVTIEARARLDGVEVPAADINDFDADEALNEAIGSYNSSVSDSGFDIEDSPTGFDEVEQATDRDTALTVYVALANAGFEVN